MSELCIGGIWRPEVSRCEDGSNVDFGESPTFFPCCLEALGGVTDEKRKALGTIIIASHGTDRSGKCRSSLTRHSGRVSERDTWG